MLQSKLAGNCNAGSRWQLESIAESEGIFHLEKTEIFKSQEWMSCVMKKDFCVCLLNKDADDPSSWSAPLFLLHSTIPIIHKSKF